MKQVLSLLLSIIFTNTLFAQKDSSFLEEPKIAKTATGDLFGTLTMPARTDKPVPVVLLIAGSGPTDRNGNQPSLKTDAFKQLASALAAHNIASLRYDKRGIGESKQAAPGEADLRFEHYVKDAEFWLGELKKDKRFSSFTIIGHSEGSLIGMLAAAKASKFISIAGAGQSADKVIKEQLEKQPSPIKDAAFPIIDSLTQGFTVSKVNPMLLSLFRPSVQPYLISWFKYDPQVSIQKLTIPTLIIQGDNDLQVSIEDAERLSKANPKAKKVVIQGMTHTLKSAVLNDRQANLKTYTDPSIPLNTELVDQIISFITQKP